MPYKRSRESRLGDQLMLCGMSVANLPLQEVIPAAALAGFECLSITAHAHRRAMERDRTSPADLRALLADHGMRVQEVEAIGDWLGPLGGVERDWLDPVYDMDKLLRLADELDAANIVATHFGAPTDAEAAAPAFAALCDRAATSGRTIALEFPAMATVADVRTAWDIVRGANRANGGLLVDNWHHDRSVASDDDLFAVPPNRIFSLQLSDATREPVGPPIDDIVHRCLPGEGQLDIVGLVSALDERGVRCPVGIEVLRRDIVGGGATFAAGVLHGSLRAVVDAARQP